MGWMLAEVPEPSTLAILLSGTVAVVLARRR
ncbi:MAG: PEP-CTERM sorting domain-containing protein [Rhodopirellula sp.]|nr:PEP-CTERM sorting domain-containing protein [Rhodopirellula sp.]